jgi:hypothetical protein
MNIVGGLYSRTCNNIIMISNAIHINNELSKKCKRIQWSLSKDENKYFDQFHHKYI